MPPNKIYFSSRPSDEALYGEAPHGQALLFDVWESFRDHPQNYPAVQYPSVYLLSPSSPQIRLRRLGVAQRSYESSRSEKMGESSIHHWPSSQYGASS